MFTNHISKILIVAFVLAAALATVTFAVRATSLPAADRAYDSIEGVRAASMQADRTYDAIEQIRAENPMVVRLESDGCRDGECYFQLPNGLWVK